MQVSKMHWLLGVVLVALFRQGLSLTAMEQVVAANNDFAMDLYDQIRDTSEGKNIFFSSFSVSSALAMVYAGVEGNTKAQIQSAMKLDRVTGNIHDGFRQLFEALNDPTNNYTLNVANALFISKVYPVLQTYINVVKQNYFSLVEEMDFALHPEPSRKYINKWVANHTNQKIQELFPDKSITENTVIALVNTIYFKGLWKQPFEKKHTKSDTFFLSEISSKKTDMMKLPQQRLRYAEVSNLDCKILELPYIGDEVSMYVLLPNTVNGLSVLESQLSHPALSAAISSMYEELVDVSMPKFKMALRLDLISILLSMGMTDMIAPGVADLSGIDGTRKLSVSKVFHMAYVDVNEEGTEAAASTGVLIELPSFHFPKIFKADHPFMFFIREKTTGSILFSGRILNPPKATGGFSSTGSEDKPSWCKDLSDWVCELFKWLGCGFMKRDS